MARGSYEAAAANFTVANQAVTLIWVNPGTTATIEFLRAYVSQAANATSAQQRIQFDSQISSFPTLTGLTPVATAGIDQASKITSGTAGAAGTSGSNASAEGGGTKTVLKPDAFNVLNGWLWVGTPPETYLWSAGLTSGFALHFPAAPATLTNWNAGLVYREW